MKRFSAVLMSVVVVGMGGEAVAQTKEKAPKPQQLVFDGSEIVGGKTSPIIEAYTVKGTTRFENLIKLRGNFKHEMERSVDDL